MMRQLRDIYVRGFQILLSGFALMAFTANSVYAQCNSVPTEISGTVFIDDNQNGVMDDSGGASGVIVHAFNDLGQLVDNTITDLLGNYTLDGLTANSTFRVEFRTMPSQIDGPLGSDNRTSVRNAVAGECDIHFGIVTQEVFYGVDPELAITCYVQGQESEYTNMATIVAVDHNFNSSSSGRMEADKLGTGSVWGLAYHSQINTIYSAAFVKQFASLKSDPVSGALMHDAIYKTNVSTGATSLFARLSQLGITMPALTYTDVEHCDYGNQVGREGLGAIEISDDEKTLYVVNIANNSVVGINTANPTVATTREINTLTSVLPTVAMDEEIHAFALKYYKNKLYVGFTLIKDTYDGINTNSSIHIVEYDLATSQETLVFSTNYNIGSWTDNVLVNFVLKIQHWLTDIEFINDDEMIISLNDRKGNRYCNQDVKFPDQKGDVLVVYKNNGAWTLENGGVANGRTGRSTNNGEGPGGGEFFGDDFFPEDEEYHNEVSLGSIHVVPGKSEVVSAVFDPLLKVYSGGLHRYSTVDGSIQAALELYSDEAVVNLGKATGFGGLTMLEDRPELEIGNLVWLDANKNGKQDPTENGIGGIILDIYNDNCEKIGTTTTDSNGYYVFNSSNVDENGDNVNDRLSPYTTYFVAFSGTQFDDNTGALTLNNETLLLTSNDIGYTSYPNASDSDAVISENVCSAIDGLGYVEVITGDLGTNDHKFDLGLTTPGNFDLALRKELVTSPYAKVDAQSTYKITIFNQGEIGAKNIVVRDYLPEGLRMTSAINNGWDIFSDYATYEIEELAAGESTEIFIHLFINPGFSYEDFINYAEIESADDQFNKPGNDVDSTPDGINDDQGGEPFQITDDEVDDDGTIDEDDHDPAALNVFDLALTKKIVNAKSGYVKGDVIKFEFYVYNQGNVLAEHVVLTDYLPAGLAVVAPSQWSLNNGVYTISIPAINPDQRAKVELDVVVESDGIATEIVNVAEISAAYLENGDLAVDYDSTMDQIKANDNGGDPSGPTDNEIFNGGEIDEDDHDPASLRLERFDLALIKKSKSTFVRPGEQVVFEITVLNQGTITADEIVVGDYLPANLEFIPSVGWSIDPVSGLPLYTMSRTNGLLPNTGLAGGQEISFDIICRLKEDAPVSNIINEAEIVSSRDFNGNDRSEDDYDSTPDFVQINDAGGEVGSTSDDLVTGSGIEDEDDHDPAPVAVMSLMLPEDCFCLSNATADLPGQFVNIFEFEFLSDVDWVTDSYTDAMIGLNAIGEEPNLDDYTIGDYVATTDLVPGQVIYESPNGDGTSVYSIEVISLDETTPIVQINSVFGGISLGGSTCTYNEQLIEGSTGACAGSTEIYSVTENMGSTYEWTLAAGGTIVGPVDEATVTVEWDAAAGGPYTLSVSQTNADLCLKAGSIDVNLGVSAGAMACIGDATVSLSSDCSVEITEDLVLTSEYSDDNVFNVIIIDEDGNMLSEPVLTGDHIGQEMTIKIMDVCSGNSCWTSLTVVDKIAPQIIEEDPLTVDCNMATNFPEPIATDNCGGLISIEMISQSFETLTCDDEFTTTITRVFTATDDQGNVSAEYTQIINLARIDVEAVVFPIDRTVADDNPLFCQQFDLDDNGNPSPLDAGVPMYNGNPIYPYMDQYCNVGVDYSDNIIAPNGCVEKVMRTWTVFEWHCGTSNIETMIQEINIADQLAPEFMVPEDFTITTNQNECIGTATLPAVSPEDDCSETFEVDIQYPDGFLNNMNGGSVDLELGENLITYTVYDGCLNSATHSFTITVEDNTVPVMVCDQNTVISLKADGTAYAPASVFDDGSVTDCSPLTLEVKRMDNGSNCGIDNFAFGEYVEFCCEDIGQEVMILLRATDEDGNSNTCMVTVVVQDKNPPVLTVPDDVTIQCTTEYDLENLGEQFGTAEATDNCMNTTINEEYVVDVTDCNVGFIYRTFFASDGNGQVIDYQIITIENDFEFNEDDITWPLDYTTDEGCNAGDLQPEDLEAPYDYPVISSDACDMISINFTDQTFTTSDDACFKIIRKYIVMDMCQMDADGMPLTFEYDQTIVVTNSVDPVITSSCEPVTVTVTNSCDEGEITLSATATDDCTDVDNLLNAYNIDLDNDGSFDIQQPGVGGSITFNSLLPVGNHRIVYSFEDRCGNNATCTQLFSIQTDAPPLAKCQDLAIELTPMDTDGDNIVDAEMTFLDVELVGGGSEHPCDFPITLSYDIEGDSTIATFDCFDLGANIVTVYVTDIFGNQSSCTATVIVQDNNDVDICPTPEDCIILPEEVVDVIECVDDLEPATIGGGPDVELPCVCDDFEITYTDNDISDPNNACVTIERTYTVSFFCFVTALEYTYVQTINQFNANPPVIVNCPDDGSGMSTNAACTAFVSLGVPQVQSGCNTGVVITNNSDFADSNIGAASGNYPVGNTVVVYTATDACGNASTCSINVMVDDLGAPNCNTMDITITIPPSGATVFIEGEDVDDGSADDCGTIIDYDVTPSSFDCGDLGVNPVVLVVTDQSGNTSECNATVTVVDEVAPLCVTQNLTFTIEDADGVITISGEDLDGGSTDACGNIVDFDATPNTFTCEDVGDNTVTLTVTDDAGNTSICDAIVTINDGVAPLCVTQDITISLMDENPVTVDAEDIDNGSSDVCGDNVSLALSPNVFDCDDLGDNTVTLTVTDDAGNTSQCTATVTVVDDVPPTALCVAPETVTITIFNPNFPVPVPASFIDNGSFDVCGEGVTLSVIPSSVGCDDKGIVPIVLTVTDNDGNTATCATTIIVVDAVGPEAIAQDITVFIEMDGSVVVDPLDIDNGSFDECGEIATYELDPNTFDCDDLGDNTVILTVTDNCGNTDTAEATVTVESNDALEAVCQDITVFLDEFGVVTIEPADVDGGSMVPCGNTGTLAINEDEFNCNDLGTNPQEVQLIVTDDTTGEMDTCIALVTVADTIPPTVNCPADLTFTCEDDLSNPLVFGEPIFDDNCLGSSMQDTIIVEDLNGCGLGTITITYIVEDLSGNSASCTQTITIEVTDENLFSEANIIWPEDTLSVFDCSSTDPIDLMSFPVIDTMDAICFSAVIEFEDISLGMGTTCQDTIQRTFTVTDTCQVDSEFEFIQIVIVDDSGAPEFAGLPADTTLVSDSNECGAFVDLSGLTVMDCTTDLIITNDSPVADNDILDASGTYPVGETIVNYTAEDGCGNISDFQISITVTEDSDPIVDCIKVFPEIQSNLMATVNPEDYIGTAFDNCSDSTDLEFIFVLDYEEGDDDLSDNMLAETITFDCDDVGILMIVNVATIDEAGNFFVCGAQTTVLDPNGFCMTPQGLVQGNVETHYGTAVQSTAMYLDGDMEDMEMVENDGFYAFDDINMGDDLNLTPFNNEEPAEGITTLDILLIQKHILGLQILPTPYDIIAADADHNETVSGTDIIQIQKVILGTYDEFPNNNSFRFVDAEFAFADPANPFASTFPENAQFFDLQEHVDQDFVGIKVGDVNGSFQGLVGNDNEPDGESKLFGIRSTHNLFLDNEMLNPTNGFVHVPVYSGEFESLQALEITLDVNGLDIERIIPGAIDIKSTDYNIGNEALKISWLNIAPIQISDSEELFTIVLRSDKAIDAQELIKMRKDVNEFYTNNADIATLRFVNKEEALRAVLHQNVPNPWTNNTVIEFEMVTDADYTFNFYTIDGRLLYTKTGFAPKGNNTIELNKSEMSINSGVIVYEFISGSRKLTKRMMLME